jgi:hypothetical protein
MWQTEEQQEFGGDSGYSHLESHTEQFYRQLPWLRDQGAMAFFFFFFFLLMGVDIRAYTFIQTTTPFYLFIYFVIGFFQDRVSCTICPGWL